MTMWRPQEEGKNFGAQKNIFGAKIVIFLLPFLLQNCDH